MQRLKPHMIAHSHTVVDPNKNKAYFLSWVGANTYELINKLFSTSELATVTFDQVVQKLNEHYKESVHELAASYQFYQCRMKPGQSYSDWVADPCIFDIFEMLPTGGNSLDFYIDEVVEATKQVLFETAFSNRNSESHHQYSHKRRWQDKKSKIHPGHNQRVPVVATARNTELRSEGIIKSAASEHELFRHIGPCEGHRNIEASCCGSSRLASGAITIAINVEFGARDPF